jgi:DNA (cytosine-5)-methyltransferase 1
LFIVLDTGDWENRRPILFERESLSRDNQPSRKKREETTRKIEESVGITSFIETFDRQRQGEYGLNDVASTIQARDFKDHSDLIVQEKITYGLVGNTIGRKPENGGNGTGFSEELMYTLTATDHHAVSSEYFVRKLTPIECERLQGFPDNWTNVNNASVSKRINALGRSMAVPVIRWIGKQIENA